MIWGWILETASLPSLDNPSLSGDNNTKAHRAARSANEMFSELSIFNDLQLKYLIKLLNYTKIYIMSPYQ